MRSRDTAFGLSRPAAAAALIDGPLLFMACLLGAVTTCPELHFHESSALDPENRGACTRKGMEWRRRMIDMGEALLRRAIF